MKLSQDKITIAGRTYIINEDERFMFLFSAKEFLLGLLKGKKSLEWRFTNKLGFKEHWNIAVLNRDPDYCYVSIPYASESIKISKLIKMVKEG